MNRKHKESLTVIIVIVALLTIVGTGTHYLVEATKPKVSYIAVEGNLELYSINRNTVTLHIDGIIITLKECPDNLEYFLGQQVWLRFYGNQYTSFGNVAYEGTFHLIGRVHEEF